MDEWAPPSKFLIQEAWGRAWEFAFLTCSQVMLMLLVLKTIWVALFHVPSQKWSILFRAHSETVVSHSCSGIKIKCRKITVPHPSAGISKVPRHKELFCIVVYCNPGAHRPFKISSPHPTFWGYIQSNLRTKAIYFKVGFQIHCSSISACAGHKARTLWSKFSFWLSNFHNFSIRPDK